MYVGSIVHPNQGVPLLIESLPAVFDAVPTARCVLVGGPAEAGGIYRALLGQYADRLIVLTGQTPSQVVALTAPGRCSRPLTSGLPGKLLGSEQDRGLSRRRPAHRRHRLRRLPAASGSHRRRPLDSPEPTSIAHSITRVLTDPALAGRLAAATGPVAREFFAMDRNIDRYLDVYNQAIAMGPR